MKNLFWWLWAFDVLIGLVALYFFFIGLIDGSVSSFNAGLWLIILAIAVGIPIISLWLRAMDHLIIAKILLSVIAVPGILYLLFILLMIFGNPRMN